MDALETIGTETSDRAYTVEQVESVLDSVRPYLAQHGGGIDLLEISGHSIRVSLRGSCKGCPSASLTLKAAVEKRLREELPEFEDLITDAHETNEPVRRWWHRFV